MFNIDQYAYSNKLRSSHPGEKFTFALLTMAICLSSSTAVTPLAVLFLMAGAVILRAGIPWRFYIKLMSLPLSFLLVSAFTIAVTITRYPDGAIHGFTILGFTVGVTVRNLGFSANLFFKSLGAVSCLYFLSLTTPMLEIISVLRKLRVPVIFIELMSLIYRFIFVVLETAEKIYTAQSSRWGYASLKTSFFSLGQLFSILFIKSYHRSQMLFTALVSRCYTDELNVLEPRYTVSKENIIIIAVVDLALTALTLYTGGEFIGRIHS